MSQLTPNWAELPEFQLDGDITLDVRDHCSLQTLNVFINDVRQCIRYGGNRLTYNSKFTIPQVDKHGNLGQEDRFHKILAHAVLSWLLVLRYRLHGIPHNQ